MTAMHPRTLVLVTSSQQIKMADNISLSFYQVLINNSCYNMVYIHDSKNNFKMNIVDSYTLYGGSKAGSKQIFQLLVSEVVDSQQWRISPSNGRLDFTRCRRFNFKVTYYCSNHLKLHMSIYRSLYYENLLSFFIKFLLFSHGYTPKSVKLPQGQRFFVSL